jgi:serine/threonine protein kinase
MLHAGRKRANAESMHRVILCMIDTQGRRFAMADYIGQQLGNYELLELLGQGGFAEVYLARHIYLKTSAAIKVLQVRLTDSALDKFLAEARTIAQFSHPHIIRVLEFGIEQGTPFLVMNYAPTPRHLMVHIDGAIKLANPLVSGQADPYTE